VCSRDLVSGGNCEKKVCMDTKQMSVGEEEGKKDSLFHLQKSVLRITREGKMRSIKKVGGAR